MKPMHIYLILFFVSLVCLLINCSREEVDLSSEVNGLFTIDALWTSYEAGDNIRSDKTVALFQPNDPEFINQWNMKMLRIQHAWAITMGRPDVVVAVVDDGIQLGLKDFETTRIDTTRDYDFAEADDDASALEVADLHGTHVAGTIAQSTNNGYGCVGIAPKVTLLPIRIFAGYDDPDWLVDGEYRIEAGIDYAIKQGADVINLSFGGATQLDPTFAEIYQKAHDAGIVVVNSSGNDNLSDVSCPGCFGTAISVGAITLGKTRTSYSNYGRELDFVAPGGEGEDSDSNGYLDQILQETYNGMSYMQGTSMAAPHVTGTIALLKSIKPNATFDEIYEALQSTAEDIGPFGKDDETGYGIVNPSAALHYIQKHIYEVTSSRIVTQGEMKLDYLYSIRVFGGDIQFDITPHDSATYEITLFDPDENELMTSDSHQLTYDTKHISGEYYFKMVRKP